MPSPEFAPPLKGGSLWHDEPSCGRGERFTAPARHSVGVVFKGTSHLSLIRIPVMMVVVSYCEADKVATSRMPASCFSLSLPAETFLSFSSHRQKHNWPSAMGMTPCSPTGTPVGFLVITFGIFSPFAQCRDSVRPTWIQISFLILMSSLNELIIFLGLYFFIWNKW